MTHTVLIMWLGLYSADQPHNFAIKLFNLNLHFHIDFQAMLPVCVLLLGYFRYALYI